MSPWVVEQVLAVDDAALLVSPGNGSGDILSIGSISTVPQDRLSLVVSK